MYLRVVVSHQAFLRWMGYFDDDDDEQQLQKQPHDIMDLTYPYFRTILEYLGHLDGLTYLRSRDRFERFLSVFGSYWSIL